MRVTRIALLGLALLLLMLLLYAALTRLRPLVGGWVYARNPNEFIWFGPTGHYTTGEGSGEMEGTWREVKPGVVELSSEGMEPHRLHYRLEKRGQVLVITDSEGQTLRLERR